MKFHVSMTAVSILFGSVAIAEPATVHTETDGIIVDATIEDADIHVGDQVVLIIEAFSEEGTVLEIKETKAFGSFMIQQQHNLLDIPIESGRTWVWTMQLDTFDARSTTLSGININWTRDNGTQGSILLNPIPIIVASFADTVLDTMELRDIKHAVPLVHTQWWPAVIGTTVVLGFVTWLVWRRTRTVNPAIPPHIIAMDELQALRDSDLDVLFFYTSLSNIVRRYITARFQIAATGQTTNEFLSAAKQHAHLSQHDRKNLGAFLTSADLVKFARYEPNDKTCQEAIDQAALFIISTAPQVETPSLEDAA